MLQDMLDDICAEIAAVAWDEALPDFARQLMLMKPALARGLFEVASDEQVSWASDRLAEGYLALIKDIPWYVNALSGAAKDPHMEGGYRAAILGSLAYLVQPRDLIPDDLPGGFGFIDDCLLLHVTTAECMAYLPRDTSTEKREVLLANTLALTVPDQRMDVFREAAEGIRHLIFHIDLMDPEQIEQTIEALQANPLEDGPATDPANFRTSSAPAGPNYFCPLKESSVAEDGRITFEFEEGSVAMFGSDIEVE